MAVGDAATAAGYPLVSGNDPKNQGYTEINRTRDLIASLPVGAKRRITVSTSDPTGGADGDVWFKVV